MIGRINHVKLVETVRKISSFAHVVDRLPNIPVRRHDDELGLHPPAGGFFRVEKAALQRDALEMRQLFENFLLLVLRKVFQNVDRVVGIELAHAVGDGLGCQFLEDLLAHCVIDFRQRREVEVLAHQLDEPGAQFRIEHFDQVAGVGFMQIADHPAQGGAVAGGDRLLHPLDERRADRPIRVAECQCLGLAGHVFLIKHAGLNADTA